MAWKESNPEDDGKVSAWNSAAYKMRRLDNEISSINESNVNPLAVDVQTGVLNLQSKFRRYENLYLEVDSKLADDERKDGDALLIKIKILMDRYPLYITRCNKLNNTKKQILNSKVYKLLERFLFEFERLVRQFIDTHGMDTSYDDDYDGL